MISLSQNVHTLSHEVLNEMKKYYHAVLGKSPQGALFRAQTENAVITAYNSGKVLFQGAHPEKEMIKWVKNNPSINTTNITKDSNFKVKVLTHSHIGSDESGTGDYFGPVTAAAVYITKEQIPHLKEMGIQDSKLIKDEDILRLSKELIKLNIPYSLLVLHNEKYNTLQSNGWSQGKMKAMLHHHAINNVIEKTDKNMHEGIVIDQFCLPDVYKRYLASEKLSVHDKTIFMTKAEHHSISVAAASVIARASFLMEMDILSKQSGYTLLKGASKKVDQLIAKIKRDKGLEFLNSIAKVHFANTDKANQY